MEIQLKGLKFSRGGVFALPCAPRLVFKISNEPDGSDLRTRWGYAKGTAEIIEQHKFDLVVLPPQTYYILTDGRRHHLIAEERLSLTANPFVHKQLYESLGARLEPALRQLVAFILATGFRDVDFRYIPILDKGLTTAPEATPKIELVDFSDLGSIEGGRPTDLP
ncbi:uncharacterized protein Triagg1_3872 [Trichoderma aggressivum f. europaeum]|uniref:Uncharacterized protein n=1 Tax=Trichoderma aggressivum f. europaeum TaxID=173218 RepID=A0AAE1IH02_9HYPO|nr:hypothetical protein Triagg1_3872 [Trichoderma aggressivum f. europaeum]